MTVTASELHCPNCDHLIGVLERRLPTNPQSVGGPAAESVRAWLAADGWSGGLTSGEALGRYEAWARRSGHPVDVSKKALAMGMQACGVTPHRQRDRRLWIR